jgi:hypothetical protein
MLAGGQGPWLVGRPEKAESYGGGEQVSQVPGEPLCIYARVFDPGGTNTPGHSGVLTRPPAMKTVRATREEG